MSIPPRGRICSECELENTTLQPSGVVPRSLMILPNVELRPLLASVYVYRDLLSLRVARLTRGVMGQFELDCYLPRPPAGSFKGIVRHMLGYS